MPDALADLAQFVATGLPAAAPDAKTKPLLGALFGGRYHQRFASRAAIRDPLITAGGFIPFAGLIHPDNPTSGTYGGASVVWFPTEEHDYILIFSWLLQAARAAADKPFLLVVDEINRADLGKVLGEAIYLFEPGETANRSVQLPYAADGEASRFALPPNLYVLGTMNTADRSIAPVDLAIRCRFSFVILPPDIDATARNSASSASAIFGALQDEFAEYAPDEALGLLSGQSFFLASDDAELRQHLRYELLPLIDEYLCEGLVAPLGPEFQAVVDQIEGFVDHGTWND